MGTRHLTRVFDDANREILCCYGQYDGYPDGYGRELAALVASRTIVNGYGADRTGVANGMGCLAALIVAHFKRDMLAGSYYIEAPGTADMGEEYEYHVRAGEFRCLKPYTTVGAAGEIKRTLRTVFKGTAAAFAAKHAPKGEVSP